MSYKALFVIDLDGTLLINGRIPINFLQLIKDYNLNFLFTIASGRNITNIQKLLGEYTDYCFIIGENGASLYHGDKPIRNRYINPIIVQSLLNKTHTPNEGIVIYSDTDIYLIKGSAAAHKYFNENNVDFTVSDTIPDINRVKKVSFYYSGRKPQRLAIEGLYCQHSTPNLIDCMPTYVSKGEALQYIQEISHIDKTNTYSFGDSDTDISLFNNSSHAYAMEEGTHDALITANHIVRTSLGENIFSVIKGIISKLE